MDEGTNTVNFALDAWTIGAVMLLAGLAFWGVRLLKQRIEEQRYQEHMADLEFEANLLSSRQGLLASSSNDAVFMQNTALTSEAVNVVAAPVYPPQPPVLTAGTQASRPDEAPPAEVKAQVVFEKLQHAGMVRGIEGYIELHGNAKGAAILRLRDGKLALLVPTMESEAFLRHHEKRVDMIIMGGSNGSAFVIRPIEQLLADGITF